MACTCVNDAGEFSDIVNCSVIGSQPYENKWVCFRDIPFSCLPVITVYVHLVLPLNPRLLPFGGPLHRRGLCGDA